MPDLWMDVDTNLSEVPVNVLPLLDDTDFKTIEAAVAYNATGMALYWHFVTTAGAYSVTAVTPTTGGNYDWTDQGDAGIYTIEIPASGGASINNDTEGFGWFTGKATGVLPWRGPTIGFRAAGLNDALIDNAYSTTRGLAGTALPAAAADAAGGLVISDAGELDIDAKLANTNEVTAARMGALTDLIDGGRLDLLIDAIKAKTDNLPTDPADDSDIDTQLAAIAGYLDTEIAAILAAVDTEVAAIKAKTDNLPASPAATGAQMDLVNAPNATAIAAVKTAMEAGGSTLATLLSRIVGTLAAGTHSAQSGDAYAVVNSGTHGNAALKTILDTTGVVLTAAGITAIWDKLLTGITTVGSIGKLIKDYLDAAISSRSSHDAAAVKTAIEAAGSHLALIKAKTDLGLLNTTWTDAKAAYLDEAISAAKTLTAAYDAAKTAAQAGDEMDLVNAPNATALAAVAVAILDTLLSAGDADALNARTVRSALRALRNKTSIAAGTMTVCKENDSDAAWTAAATTDPAAEPITEIDPA